jgi:hypothetical protein
LVDIEGCKNTVHSDTKGDVYREKPPLAGVAVTNDVVKQPAKSGRDEPVAPKHEKEPKPLVNSEVSYRCPHQARRNGTTGVS